MVLSPLTMLLFHAHAEIQRATGGAWDDEWMGGFLGEGGATGDRAGDGGGGHGQRHLRAVGRFQGQGRRLDPASATVLTPPEEEGGQKIPGLYAAAKGSGSASSSDLVAQDILRPGLIRQASEDDR